MSVDRGISGSAGQVLVLTVGDMEVSLGVSVLLGQTKVNYVDLVTSLSDTHQEVVGLNITVDERLGVYVLDARDELVGQEEHRLQGELAVAEVEEILQAGAEKIQYHSIIVTLGSEPTDEGDTDTAGKGLVDTGLILELRVLRLDRLKLNSNLFARNDVGAQVDITERTGANLSTDAVLITDTEILRQVVSKPRLICSPPLRWRHDQSRVRQIYVDRYRGKNRDAPSTHTDIQSPLSSHSN